MSQIVKIAPNGLDEMSGLARRHVADLFSLGSVYGQHQDLYEDMLAAA